ncbi:MAG TPA: quinone-dependent dihydroorotate dehydrogenase [Anaerolineaceae bacterium]|nr:quinone-dependent dihydroorotate dehydrogenase [Anaerolineaceae bacterium]
MELYPLLRPLIFRLDPEAAHRVTLALLRLAAGSMPGRVLVRAMFAAGQSADPVEVFGLRFPNRLGMAAGYDKDALAWQGLALLGFGHVEVGTVTPQPQAGNPRPRIFRLVEDRAVINRMGFPNQGAAAIARRLAGGWRPKGAILGVNIGKNKDTPLEEAAQDYLDLLRIFAPLCDYLAINVSSPNTPGLRSLQTRQALERLLNPLAAGRAYLPRPLPLLVKLSPDLLSDELDGALEAILSTGMDGLIASNTTLNRERLFSSRAGETGGLSGAPLKARNTCLIREISRRLGQTTRLPVVASGGVMSVVDAREKLDAGAVLVQLYTGLIYAGPGLVRKILSSPENRPSCMAYAI